MNRSTRKDSILNCELGLLTGSQNFPLPQYMSIVLILTGSPNRARNLGTKPFKIGWNSKTRPKRQDFRARQIQDGRLECTPIYLRLWRDREKWKMLWQQLYVHQFLIRTFNIYFEFSRRKVRR